MRQWEVWKIDLTKIIDSTTLIQISEDKYSFIFCIIVTGQNFLDTYHAPTVLPIYINCKGNYSAVSIEGSKLTGLFCESYIICDQILTIHRDVFVKKLGLVPENLRSKIQKKIFDYFKD
jgi:mRNA-degrading endonuclease toxin of MazEF toxin-antitoxin module